jgi:uncharacterized membrane protein YsdA (DUF1294 family)
MNPKRQKRNNGSMPIIGAALFVIIVGVSVLAGRIPLWILAFYMAVSLLTFIIYAVDKSAAKRKTWRTKESTLHMLSLTGGWPGALIAQQKLHHKIKKQPFRFVFWVTVLLNCLAFAWLLTPTGAAVLLSFPGW